MWLGLPGSFPELVDSWKTFSVHQSSPWNRHSVFGWLLLLRIQQKPELVAEKVLLCGPLGDALK
jgi:hypothetical protein